MDRCAYQIQNRTIQLLLERTHYYGNGQGSCHGAKWVSHKERDICINYSSKVTARLKHNGKEIILRLCGRRFKIEAKYFNFFWTK